MTPPRQAPARAAQFQGRAHVCEVSGTAEARSHAGPQSKFDREGHMTFTEWLKSQGARKDAIGDLARTTAGDLSVPKGDARYAHWREHLEDKQAGRAVFRALEEAWREYGVLH